jgi:hypothetical protein
MILTKIDSFLHEHIINTSVASFYKMSIVLIQIICVIVMAIIYHITSVLEVLENKKVCFEEEEEPDFSNIIDAVKYVLQKEKIRSRNELDKWCGGRHRERLYDEVQRCSRIHWMLTENPKLVVRRVYESIFSGYTNTRV